MVPFNKLLVKIHEICSKLANQTRYNIFSNGNG